MKLRDSEDMSFNWKPGFGTTEIKRFFVYLTCFKIGQGKK